MEDRSRLMDRPKGGTRAASGRGGRRRAESGIEFRRSGLGNFRQRSGRLRSGRRVNLRRWSWRSEFAGPHDLINLTAVKRFVFEQTIGDQLQFVAMAVDNVLRDAKLFAIEVEGWLSPSNR